MHGTTLFLASLLAAGPVELSLQEAMERAAARAPLVQLAASVERQAIASGVGAGVILPSNPRLYGEARADRARGADGYAAALEAPFELFGGAGARVEEARRRAQAAGADLATERQLARYRAWELYLELALAAQRLSEADAAIEIAARIAEASARQLEAGASSEIDVAVATASLAEQRALREALVAGREELLLALRELIDLPPDAVLVLGTPAGAVPACSPGAPDPGERVGQNPELVAIRARIELLERGRDRLEKEARPKVSVLLGVDAAPGSPAYGQLGLGVELPVAQRNQGARAVAAEQVGAEQLRLALVTRRLVRELDARRRACAARGSEVRLLTEEALPAARRNLELVERGWRAGKFDLFRVTTATRDLVRLAQARLDVLSAAWREHIAIQRLVNGGPNP
jgi:cobalt-zinc-cadmium efflux system outer membrane protein